MDNRRISFWCNNIIIIKKEKLHISLWGDVKIVPVVRLCFVGDKISLMEPSTIQSVDKIINGNLKEVQF